MNTGNRPGSDLSGPPHALRAALLALFFAYAPVYAPPWRSDPGQRLNWVLDVGPAPDAALPDLPGASVHSDEDRAAGRQRDDR